MTTTAALERSARRRGRAAVEGSPVSDQSPGGKPDAKKARRSPVVPPPELENGVMCEGNVSLESGLDCGGAMAEPSGGGGIESPGEGFVKSGGKSKSPGKKSKSPAGAAGGCRFEGEPFPKIEAEQRWPHRYPKASGLKGAKTSVIREEVSELVIKARCHYEKAIIDACQYSIGDCAYVKAGEGEQDFICRIEEFFKGLDDESYFTARWFYRDVDTVIKGSWKSPESKKRVFLSDDKNDNPLDCIVAKVAIARVKPNVNFNSKGKTIPDECELYYDMSYSVEYSQFANLPETARPRSLLPTFSSDNASSPSSGLASDNDSAQDQSKSLSLLDLYSGCGAMSTGLCLGAKFEGANLETRWAVDLNEFACESLKKNHPNTEVRNEDAESFRALLLEWEKLCKKYSLIGTESSFPNEADAMDSEDDEDDGFQEVPKGEFVVEKLIGICYGDPTKIGEVGLKFKVRWKGYGPIEDTWEPIKGLSKCQERIEDFVRRGYKRTILPLPGTVDVVCGGPPCQGISGFNRFRESEQPLKDEKNKQIVVYMDIVEFLKPRYVLMENVVDLLKFSKGFLGRYAVGRLVSINYQTRMGLMAAGCYGLPQFRMRAFLWGALPTEALPQFPLPTHDVVVRGGAPNEFEQNIVAYAESQPRKLEKALLLGDAISDLPAVTNNEEREEIPYGGPPQTEFQRYIRLSQAELTGQEKQPKKGRRMLSDHRPYVCNKDDYLRVCEIPKKKGANFRNLPGVKVNAENVVEWDPDVPRVLLPSGKPLVPDYAMSFVKGKSPKPFGRLWWDETVPTVVTRAEPHNQAILHPCQDRVLTIRENARLQGFPDYYLFAGCIKERYIQIGNAVAVPVARALGFCLARAMMRHKEGNGPLCTLPPNFVRLDISSRDSGTDEEVSQLQA